MIVTSYSRNYTFRNTHLFVESADVELVFKDLKNKINQANDMVLSSGANYHLVNKLENSAKVFLHQAAAEAKRKYLKYTSAKHSWHNWQSSYTQDAFNETESSLRNFINHYAHKLCLIFAKLRIEQVSTMS